MLSLFALKYVSFCCRNSVSTFELSKQYAWSILPAVLHAERCSFHLVLQPLHSKHASIWLAKSAGFVSKRHKACSCKELCQKKKISLNQIVLVKLEILIGQWIKYEKIYSMRQKPQQAVQAVKVTKILLGEEWSPRRSCSFLLQSIINKYYVFFFHLFFFSFQVLGCNTFEALIPVSDQ